MENEARIRREIRNALDPVVRSAPWLEDSIRESIRGQSTLRGFRPVTMAFKDWSVARTLVAVLLVLALIAAFVVGSRALSRPHDVPVKPNPAVLRYRTVVDRDFTELEHLVITGIPGDCAKRAPTCRELVLLVKAATQKFESDLSDVTLPAQLQANDAYLRKGLAHIRAVLDAMLSALDRGDFEAYTQASATVFDIKIQEVWPAVTGVDCWPKAAIEANDPLGIFRLRCSAEPSTNVTQKYVAAVYADWDLLHNSITSTNGLCSSHGQLCRERTLRSRLLAQQFISDTSSVIVPVQFRLFDQDLHNGLTELLVRLDNRLAAIDAADSARWDAANISIEQIHFNVLAKAIAEIACWPKGVAIGNDSSATAWPCSS